MKRLQITALLVFMVALVPGSGVSAQNSIEELRLLTLINDYRLSENLAPLVLNDTLNSMAAVHANYLLTEPDINAINVDINAQGDDIEQRARYDRFAWEGYHSTRQLSIDDASVEGQSELFALNWWLGSNLYADIIVDPTWREVGIATRAYNQDTGSNIYIAVFGSRPNGFTAVADAQRNRIYLSREQAEFATQNGPRAGEFVDDVTEFRLLDLNGNALTDFEIWRPAINFDERIAFVEYLGLNEVSAIAPVTPLNNNFALTEAQQQIIARTASDSVAAAAPAGGTLLVIHDARSLMVVNTSSQPINLSAVSIGNEVLSVDATAWEAASVGLA
ncbi:MAG: CAP domain-containing protein, partial [Chloroflexota bacterium]